MTNLLNLLPNQLEAFFKEIGEPKFRAKQLLRWIHHDRELDFAQMSNFPKALREKLAQKAQLKLPEIILDQQATDGTRKWLLQLEAGNAIETVFIPEENRGTLCISSQVGCALNCSFCSTGKQGFNRNLSLGEILGQVWIAREQLLKTDPEQKRPITNIVFMGMGEPLLNYEPMLAALKILLSDDGYGLSKYRVTVSTSGVVPKMLQLKTDCDCALAVSLHAPTNEIRDVLVPLNKKYPLEQLMPVCRDYFPAGGKHEVMFEYVMLAGVNDQLQQAKDLAKLLEGMNCKVNLIPFNPFTGSNYKTSDSETVAAFQKYLISAGVRTFVRKTRGDDIDGACGQLAGDFKDRTGRHARWQKTGKLRPD